MHGQDMDQLLDDLAAAESAGVFAGTAQPKLSQALTGSSTRVRIFGVSPKFALAATFLMAVGVWSFMFQTKLSDLKDRVRLAQLAQNIDIQSALATCFGGPSGTLSLPCQQADLDHDGDVDLGDYSSFQRDPAAVSQ